MDWTLILTAIGTAATVVSTIVAVRAKNEAKKILKQIKEEKRIRLHIYWNPRMRQRKHGHMSFSCILHIRWKVVI